jgi:transcriptional regulator of acetoin/glycerol metabolism
MKHPSPALPAAALPPQPFFASPGQRVGLARERFFGEGQRPTGLVNEAVIQSWTRCLGARRSPLEALAFDPVARGRLRAALERSRPLLTAAGAEIERLESALAGTGCRVLLTDAEGVIVHTTATSASPAEPTLRRVSRLGVNLAEGSVGTNAPAVVVKTGQPVTVLGAEHYFDCVQSLHCAASPIRDGHGRLAGVLDLTVEARPFGFDAAALVGVYATAIENRLLQAGTEELLVLQFQVCSTMLGSPLQALLGVDGQGRVAWLNSTAQQLLGPGSASEPDAERLLGTTLGELLARSTSDEARPLRLRNGLTVWLRARLQARDGVKPVVAMPAAPDASDSPAALPAAAAVDADGAAPPAAPAPASLSATLDQHTREVIERTLAEHAGNISRAARRLGVSRGLLYRRLREWRRAGSDGSVPPAGA